MFLPSVIEKIKSAPKTSGVYIFYKGAKPLYVGKAVNLKNRLASYLKEGVDSKTDFLQKESDRLVLRRLSSGIKALIAESRLIKKLQPIYNVIMKDDKSYFYVFISKDKFPKIFVRHKLLNTKFYILNSEYIGPFTDGQSLKIVVRALRRFFPYCACKSPHRRLCLNAQIDNCPGFCCQISDKPASKERIKQYNKNITSIKNFLLGKKTPVKLQKELERLTSDKLAAFENVSGHRELVKSYEAKPRKIGLRYCRAECYDISHLSGKEAVGAMTAWVKKNGVWEAEKSSWRKFRIKTAPKSDDPAAIAEVIQRRFNHPEWSFPDLVIIDGGLGQLRAAQKIISFLQTSDSKLQTLKIVSFAKPHQLVYGLSPEPLKIEKTSSELSRLIKKAIYYTHNFAIRYHKRLRNFSMHKARYILHSVRP